VQQVTAIPAPKDQGVRRYLLTGLVICAVCGRRMDAHWVHGRPGYRCRHGYSSARSSAPRARNVYWAEQRIIDGLLYQLSYAGELPFLADTSELLDHLRKRRVVVVCGVDTLDVEPVDLGKQVTPPQSSLEWMTLVGVNVSEGGLEPPRPIKGTSTSS
jgi:hypothetical protein